jgi:hypothetical protein
MKPVRLGNLNTTTKPNTNATATSRHATVMGWIMAATATVAPMVPGDILAQ